MRRTRTLAAATAAAIAAALALTPSALAQDQILLGADGTGGNIANTLQVLDPATGATLETIGDIGVSVTGLAEDPTTGILYGVTARLDLNYPAFLVRIDQTTGKATPIGSLRGDPTNTDPVNDITFTSDGTLYGWERTSNDLVTIDKVTGLATVVGDSGLNTFGNGIAADATDTIWVAPRGDKEALYTVDRATGAVTAGPTMSGVQGESISALAFDAAGALFGAHVRTGSSSGAAQLININTTTGLITPLGPSRGLDAIEFVDVSVVTLSLKANKKKVKKGKKVTLSGSVEAGTETACEAGQTVEILRKQKGERGFSPFKQVTTDAGGAFRVKAKVKKPATYSAEVSGPAVCADAASKNAKVKLKKPKRS